MKLHKDVRKRRKGKRRKGILWEYNEDGLKYHEKYNKFWKKYWRRYFRRIYNRNRLCI